MYTFMNAYSLQTPYNLKTQAPALRRSESGEPGAPKASGDHGEDDGRPQPPGDAPAAVRGGAHPVGRQLGHQAGA